MNTDDAIMKRLNPDRFGKPQGGMAVDPAVRLGPIDGEINGSVDMSITIGKPQAYKTNRYSKDMGNE